MVSVYTLRLIYSITKSGSTGFNIFPSVHPVWQHTFVSPSAFSRRAVVSYWRKYVHEVLVNRLGGLSLPRKSVVRLTDRPDMTLVVYCRRKTTIQQQQPSVHKLYWNTFKRSNSREATLHLLPPISMSVNF